MSPRLATHTSRPIASDTNLRQMSRCLSVCTVHAYQMQADLRECVLPVAVRLAYRGLVTPYQIIPGSELLGQFCVQLGMSCGLERFYVQDIVRMGVAVEPIVSELFFLQPTIFVL